MIVLSGRNFRNFPEGNGKANYARAVKLPRPALPFFLSGFRLLLFLFLLIFSPLQEVQSQSLSPLPLIPGLNSRDAMFKQYQQDVEAARRMFFSYRLNTEEREKELASSLTIFCYVPLESDDLLGIAARCNIPYGSLASLNRFSHAEDMMP